MKRANKQTNEKKLLTKRIYRVLFERLKPKSILIQIHHQYQF